KRCARDMQEVSMLMIDIDHFKAFNDRYGHGAGDVCLRRVAQALSSVLHRSLEMLCRYGGEEFAAVLPSVGRDKALPLAEAMLKAVYDLGIPHDSSPAAPVVTVSIGCASLLATPEGSPLDLARRADEALYAAKKEGRNRVSPA
ncbi:MAG TPA: diguanylate cyclase, partial [Treponemataceae bacterium]|nr:diguanylate cyclase [Treponemataceae bacterium]